MILKQKNRIWDKSIALLFVAVLLVATLSGVSKVSALGALTNMWAVESNMDASGSSQLYLAFKSSATGGVPGTISIALTGTGAAVATTNANLGTTATCATAFQFLPGGAPTGVPGSPTATGASATISLTGVTSLAASTNYCVAFTGASAVTNPSAAGVYSYTMTDTQDTGTAYYSILTGGTNESISVTATVPQTFTLTLGGSTDPLNTLSTSGVTSTTGVNATVSTNAANGLGIWAYDSSTGLHSTNASHTIASTSPGNATAVTITSSAEGYITNAAYQSNTSGATLSVTTPFTGTGGTGDGLNGIPAEIASATAPTNAAIVKVKESATITATTPEATDYADTVTIVGAGSF